MSTTSPTYTEVCIYCLHKVAMEKSDKKLSKTLGYLLATVKPNHYEGSHRMCVESGTTDTWGFAYRLWMDVTMDEYYVNTKPQWVQLYNELSKSKRINTNNTIKE